MLIFYCIQYFSNYEVHVFVIFQQQLTFLKNISNDEVPDRELIAAYKTSGDIKIVGRLYQRYMDLVYGVCMKYFKESEAAKDGVMHIFEDLVQKLRHHEVENFRSWLYTVAKNHCLMELRTPRNLRTVEFNPAVVQSSEPVHLNSTLYSEEQFKGLENCLQTLSKEQKEAVELFYLQNKCYNEISGITGHDWKKVRSLIQNGRRNLKICMDKQVAISE